MHLIVNILNLSHNALKFLMICDALEAIKTKLCLQQYAPSFDYCSEFSIDLNCGDWGIAGKPVVEPLRSQIIFRLLTEF